MLLDPTDLTKKIIYVNQNKVTSKSAVYKGMWGIVLDGGSDFIEVNVIEGFYYSPPHYTVHEICVFYTEWSKKK